MSLPPEKKEECQEVFNFFDRDLDGRVSREEFSDAIKTLGIFIPKKELDTLLDKISVYDYDNYEKVCASKLSEKINKDEIIKGFWFLDSDRTGLCPKDRLRYAFMTLGEPFKPDEIDNLLQEYSKGSQVDYRELVSALVGK